MNAELEVNLRKTLDIVKGLYLDMDNLHNDIGMDEDIWNEKGIEIGSTIYGYINAIATMCGLPEENVTISDCDHMNCDEFFNKETDWPEDLWSRDPYEIAIYNYCTGELTFEVIVDMITSLQELAKDFTPREKQSV